MSWRSLRQSRNSAVRNVARVLLSRHATQPNAARNLLFSPVPEHLLRPPGNARIVARDPASGMFGVAASTRLPAVGVLVPYARAGVGAIATQARTNPLLRYDGLDLLQRGYDAEETLQILLGSDPEPEKRQVGIADSRGGSAAHTGAKADPWHGHVTGDGYAVTGNLVAGEEVILAMAAAFEASEGEILPERLVRALEAGQAAGGDKRGKQSAAINTIKDQPYPYIDLRVDEHPDPIVELRRIYEVFKVQMLPFVEALPTRRKPKGDFGEEIRGSLIPNGGLSQADGKAPEEDMPPPQDLQTTPRGS